MNVVLLISVRSLSGQLKLPQTVESVAVSQFFDIPLYIEKTQGCVKRGQDVEVCEVTILKNARGVRGINTEESDYSFAVAELVISVSFEPGFSSSPVVLLTFEDQRVDGDIFQDCLVKPVPSVFQRNCIMWTNGQFTMWVEPSYACIHYLFYFSISGLDQTDSAHPLLSGTVVQALNEFVLDIINKTAIDIQAVGPVGGALPELLHEALQLISGSISVQSLAAAGCSVCHRPVRK